MTTYSIEMLRRRTAGILCIAVAAGSLAAGTLVVDAAEKPPRRTVSVAPPTAAARTAAKSITTAELQGAIRFLSDDLLEGRAPGSRGDALARAYIASRMEAMGLEPGGPAGGWEQPFEVVGTTATLPPSWRFESSRGALDLQPSTEYMAYAGLPAAEVRLDAAPLVFVGYGIRAPEYDWDDFGATDLRGKVLLVMNDDPDWDPKLFAGKTRLYYGRWDYKYEEAARRGAAGCIIVHTTPSAGYAWSVVQSSWNGEQFELPAAAGPRLQVRGWVSEDAARKLVAHGGHDLDALRQAARKRPFAPVSLDMRTSFTITSQITRKTTANVCGLWRGADPALRDEVVVYTAHHDHLGVGEPDSTGDAIFNGAVDNASGVAQLLGMARAFTALAERPRRSILFLAVGGEESGLLGSEWYAQHPTVPPAHIAAALNFDGAQVLGRSRDIVQIGRGKTTLDAVMDAGAKAQGRVVVADLFPDRGFFYRSDQFSFARIGVPAAGFDSGLEILGQPAGWGRARMEAWEAAHYHRPSDEMQSTWNLDGAVEDAQLGFYTGLAIANTTEPPQWTPGDEFEAVRKASMSGARH